MTKFNFAALLVSITLLSACSPTKSSESTASAPKVDEQSYKQNFSNNFNRTCYQGFLNGFQTRSTTPSDLDLQAAKQVCECISYNLVNSNDVKQLQALEQKQAAEALKLTQPLIQSCSEQVRQQLKATTAAASEASATQHNVIKQ